MKRNDPLVGVLVNNKLFQGIPRGEMGHEALRLYEEAGLEYGLRPCYFRLNDVSEDMTSTYAYIRSNNGYLKKQVPLPAVIHNRAIFRSVSARQTLKRIEKSGRAIFNRWNRYPKQLIHDLLLREPALWVYMPETLPATLSNVSIMMNKYSELIIKPNQGSIGRGVMKLSMQNNCWKLQYASTRLGKKGWRSAYFRKQLPIVLQKRLLSRQYIVQQCLPLATYKGRPFDIRISVQRCHSGEWQVTGMIAKAAAKGRFLTNVAQGGSVHSVEDILSEYPNLKPKRIKRQFAQFALRIVSHLDQHLPHLADIGLDVGMATDGTPLFIECNSKDQRYSFYKGGMQEVWYNTYRHPIGYAKYLMDQRQPSAPIFNQST